MSPSPLPPTSFSVPFSSFGPLPSLSFASKQSSHTSRIFINRVVNFVGVGLSLYALASVYQYFSHDPIIKHTVKCKYCRKRISEKVSVSPTEYIFLQRSLVLSSNTSPSPLLSRPTAVSTARAGWMAARSADPACKLGSARPTRSQRKAHFLCTAHMPCCLSTMDSNYESSHNNLFL